MTQEKLFWERRMCPRRSPRVQEQVTLWEERFRQARTPEARYGAMSQLRRWTENHPLIQMWEERDPRFHDMSWTLRS